MKSAKIRHRILMLYSGIVRLLTRPALDEIPLLRRFRGALYAAAMSECGSNLQVSSDAILWGLEHMELGRDIYIGPRVSIICLDKLRIGDGVLLGPNVVISNGNHVREEGIYKIDKNESHPIAIGAGSWIGANAAILAGVTIGKGVLVAANAVVSRDVPDGDVVGGIPARSLRKSPDEPA